MTDSDPKPPSRFRRVLGAVGRAALLPVRGAGYLVRSGKAHQHFFLPVLNGALGDQLAARYDARAIKMSFRQGERDVAVPELCLAQPHQKTVVFLHGLMGDELIWQAGFQDAPDTRRYGPRLAEEAHIRPLYLRFNSGLHLSENGRELNRLLTELVETYPDAIGELVLVGHSMGGLIIRSAGYYASQASLNEELRTTNEELGETKELAKNEKLSQQESSPNNNSSFVIPHSTLKRAPWLSHLRSIFLLGTPNDGSWLEQNSHLTARLLQRIDLFPTRFLSKALNKRSNGIKDLRFSILVDEDWQDAHADDLTPPRTPVPPLPGVQYHILMGAWLRSTRPSALREYFGDGLVGQDSARGHATFGEEAALQAGASVRTAVFSQQHHGGLLTHPGVFQYLKQWV
ncbi:alpha/beta hydrolase [Hymenobacter sp. BT770]|uniref:esterase/lipase family protein n=1 Tax=Hymenobacter sp. BT770 TaxID=2886942 RepID=UPI001D1217B3|nr:alpha/beta hydrolase [Hymenobacter sp. BT770]MCC3154241.1 alpha/beta hydrolase [Hymenobacter sp. BT770]MDO3416379.1 alpha/beta hydrolase [Hymenobacter sp. BT770]